MMVFLDEPWTVHRSPCLPRLTALQLRELHRFGLPLFVKGIQLTRNRFKFPVQPRAFVGRVVGGRILQLFVNGMLPLFQFRNLLFQSVNGLLLLLSGARPRLPFLRLQALLFFAAVRLFSRGGVAVPVQRMRQVPRRFCRGNTGNPRGIFSGRHFPHAPRGWPVGG